MLGGERRGGAGHVGLALERERQKGMRPCGRGHGVVGKASDPKMLELGPWGLLPTHDLHGCVRSLWLEYALGERFETVACQRKGDRKRSDFAKLGEIEQQCLPGLDGLVLVAGKAALARPSCGMGDAG